MKLPQDILNRWNKISRPGADRAESPQREKTRSQRDNTQRDKTELELDTLKWTEEINDRSKEVMDSNPSFFPDLMYILSGMNTEDMQEKGGVSESGPRSAKRKEKERAKLKDKMLRSFSAEEIKGLCKRRYSLMTLEDFLQILNRMNSASSGNLLRDKQ